VGNLSRPWSPGAATAIGSMPGTDPRASVQLAFDVLPDLPFLPELPARGPGAEMVGRAAALLVDLPAEIQPSGWRLTSRTGRDLRRARDFLAADLDALSDAAAGYAGPLKVQCTGPLTLAASVELRTGHRIVTDAGAVRDLAASLAAGIADHVETVRVAVPAGKVIVQLDEPSLPAVLAGTIPTASGFGTIRAVPSAEAQDRLAAVLGPVAAGCRVVHCCADDVPVGMLRDAGADAVSFDVDRRVDPDLLGEAVDAGASLWIGVVPGTGAARPRFQPARDRIAQLWQRLGFPAAELAAAVVPTPACGLAAATPEYVQAALEAVRDAGRALLDLS
jgi:methionine synthase II (cobalamin-independent)